LTLLLLAEKGGATSTGALLTKELLAGGAVLFLALLLLNCAGWMGLWRARCRLQRAVRRRDALDACSDRIFFEYDVAADKMHLSIHAKDVLLLPDDEILRFSQVIAEQKRMDPDDVKRTWESEALPKDRTGKKHEMHTTDVRLWDSEGMCRWFECRFERIYKNGRLKEVFGSLEDVTDRRRREQRLLKQAQTDLLTDTYNRAGEAVINRLLQVEESGMMLMVDLDNFKSVNDTYGHAVGDLFLKELGLLLKSLVREEDVVARVGGDEFVIFIPGSDDQRIARIKAALITEKVANLRIKGYKEASVSASIGVAVCPNDGTRYQTLFEAADQAMYVEKQRWKAESANRNGADRRTSAVKS